jgi:ABC-2 type transport system ATP-binding protein
MADRVGVISKGELIVVDEKTNLMAKLGKKQLTLQLDHPIEAVPAELAEYKLELSPAGTDLTYHYENEGEQRAIAGLLRRMNEVGVTFKDLSTEQSSLEDIFVSLVRSGQ